MARRDHKGVPIERNESMERFNVVICGICSGRLWAVRRPDNSLGWRHGIARDIIIARLDRQAEKAAARRA